MALGDGVPLLFLYCDTKSKLLGQEQMQGEGTAHGLSLFFFFKKEKEIASYRCQNVISLKMGLDPRNTAEEFRTSCNPGHWNHAVLGKRHGAPTLGGIG